MRMHARVLALAPLLALSSCAPPEEPMAPPPPPSVAPPVAASAEPPPPEDPAPRGRLPADVRPIRYALAMTLVPERPTFEGTVEIELSLEKARSVIWMHARGHSVREATVTPEGGAPIAAKLEQVTEDGVAAVRPARPLAPGRATLKIVFERPYLHHAKGLYNVKAGGRDYAFTQLEDIHAREAFPCFDEPAFKTPYSISLTVKNDHEAVSNSQELGRDELPGGMKRVRFAPTEPLPSYLVALAAGPLDIVEAPAIAPNSVRTRPVPLRGVAVKGRGSELAYALEHTGEILNVLEEQVGLAYPYAKLDLLAVPDRDGAMENPGAVTFREYLVLLDPKTAPVSQRRAFAGVMAHELAHMWFGDYVTMPWWDDTWLNEAFATWMGTRATQLWRADTEAETHQLERVTGAMGTDALVSARRIRQPIESTHDIRNAFDDITYSKGAGVIAMFERWMGKDAFKKGVRAYLESHRMGNATADDLMKSLSESAGKDVGTPFRTFLDQPGVPLVEAKVVCDGKPRVVVHQSRYFSLGSKGDANATWQIPVCARYQVGKDVKESCTLLAGKDGEIPLDGCPEWVHPNADAAGYFRFTLAPADLEKLEKHGFSYLSTREKMALAGALRAGFARGTTPAGDVYAALEPFAKDPHPLVADEPMGMLRTARDWLWGDALVPKLEAYARSLYARHARSMSWDPKQENRTLATKNNRTIQPESPEISVLRQRVLGFLVQTARDPAVRREAKKRGLAYLGVGGDGKLHPEAVDSDLAGLAVSVALEDGDAALFDAVLAKLAVTEDEVVRGRLLSALGSARAPELAARARELVLDPRLRVGETLNPIGTQLGDPRTRDAAWAWMKEHLDAVIEKVSPARAGSLPELATYYCDEAHAKELEALFATRSAKLDGGPRKLAGAMETLRLCAARRAAQEQNIRVFFRKR